MLGDDQHDAAELTRLTTALGVQRIDGKTAAARARVSGVFIAGEGDAMGEKEKKGVRLRERAARVVLLRGSTRVLGR